MLRGLWLGLERALASSLAIAFMCDLLENLVTLKDRKEK